jgi:hypothetical protein
LAISDRQPSKRTIPIQRSASSKPFAELLRMTKSLRQYNKIATFCRAAFYPVIIPDSGLINESEASRYQGEFPPFWLVAIP